MKTATERTVILAALGLAALLVGACASVDGEIARARVYRDTENVGFAAVTPQAASASTAKNRYLAIQAKKNKTDARASIVLPCDLWAPFRWEITAGVFDLDLLDETDGAIFGTELDERGPFPPTRFYGVSAEVIGGGLNAYAFSHTSGSALGSFFFANATRVEFAIEADGAMMTFLARAAGTTTWQTIATVPFAGQTVPLNPSIGVFNFADKGKVGFDDARLVSNGVAPNPLTPEQEVARMVWEAGRGILDSMNGLDGAAPDYASAETDLGESLATLEAARTATDQVSDATVARKTDKQIKKAAGKVEDALRKVDREKASSAIGKLESAFERILRAVDKVDPRD